MENEITEEITDDPVIRSSWLENKINPDDISPAGTTTTVVKLRRVNSAQFVTEKNPRGEKYIVVTTIGDAYLNWTSFKKLRTAFGDDAKLWRGKQVTITKRLQMVVGTERTVLYFVGA